MSNKKLIPLSLKNPDKIILHYGDKKIELQNTTSFSDYIVYCSLDEVEDLKPYMADVEYKK